MTAAGFAALVKDLRAAGIDYEPEIDRLPFLVRQQTELFGAIGQLCQRVERPRTFPEYMAAGRLRRRCLDALRWIEAVGARSIWAKRGWFKHVKLEVRP